MDTHPYYPPGARLSGAEFAENDIPVIILITVFGACISFLMVATLYIAKQKNPKLSVGESALVLWFVMSGAIHLGFESFFVLNNSRIAGMNTMFAQLWKEYALSDSRYMSSDPLVLCMETWTVILWGPLCILTAISIVSNSPYRYPVQALVSTGHLYGNLIYLSTSFYEDIFLGIRYYRPEPFYLWIYFVVMNSPWLVVPSVCLYASFKETANAFAMSNKGKGEDEVWLKKLL